MEGRRRIFWGIGILTIVAAGYLYYYLIYQHRPARINLDFPETTQVGQEFSVPLKITVPVVINAGEFYFTYPKDLITVKSIDTASSIFSLWITGEPKFDNKTGNISFAGGLPTPGFIGKDGLIGTVNFTAKKVGHGEVTLDQTKSRILANDGQGTEIKSVFSGINFKIND